MPLVFDCISELCVYGNREYSVNQPLDSKHRTVEFPDDTEYQHDKDLTANFKLRNGSSGKKENNSLEPVGDKVIDRIVPPDELKKIEEEATESNEKPTTSAKSKVESDIEKITGDQSSDDSTKRKPGRPSTKDK